MPERSPEQPRRAPNKGDGADPPRRRRGFLDEPEPDWVDRLKENRKAQVRQWEQVLGDAKGSDPEAVAEAATDADPEDGSPREAETDDRTRARTRLRRTADADRSRTTPSFYDQDEEET